MKTPISVEFVSQRLRAIRHSRSMSLLDVELESGGLIKAVVLGSYERGSRALSVKRAIQLAEFYEVPVHHLFGSPSADSIENPDQLLIDVRRMKKCAESINPNEMIYLQTLARFLTHIQNKREDWNGEIISLRIRDLEPIAVFLGITQKTLFSWLQEQRLLFVSQR